VTTQKTSTWTTRYVIGITVKSFDICVAFPFHQNTLCCMFCSDCLWCICTTRMHSCPSSRVCVNKWGWAVVEQSSDWRSGFGPVWWDAGNSLRSSSGLRAGCSGVRIPIGARNFSHHYVQTSSGAHPASYTMGPRGSFPGVKQPEREADHSPPCSAEIENAWSYTFTPQYAFMPWCSVK
jgi:hypothetical protein